MKKESTQSMTQYTNEFLSKAEQLEEAGIKIPDELLLIMLLNSLPTEYKSSVSRSSHVTTFRALSL